MSLLREHLLDIDSAEEAEKPSPNFAVRRSTDETFVESDELVEKYMETGNGRGADAV